MTTLLMLDICSGLEGASAAMKKHGWRVVTVDNNPIFNPVIVADIRSWSWLFDRPDLIWCSPPCTDFAREFFVWCRTGIDPDMSIVLACKRIIEEAKPIYWVIENVRGAVKWFRPYFGEPSKIIYPYYLWGHFPDIGHVHVRSNKEHLSSSAAAERAKIPYAISKALTYAIEMQPELILV